jgi:hypothetical protein
MPDPEILDLDVLRPPKKIVRLAGKTIDVSMIPCGITFEIDKIVRDLMLVDQTKVDENGEETRKAFDLTVKCCAIFASVEHPEMTEEWFRKNVDARQAAEMAKVIRDTLLSSYEGVKAYGKN